MDPTELAIAEKQIQTIKRYFDGAIEKNNQAAQDDLIEQDGKNYADRDKICQAICAQSILTFR